MPEDLRKPKIYIIPAKPRLYIRVGIYCRVSTMSKSQEDSLENQIAGLQQFVSSNPEWTLCHTYIDQDSGGNVMRPGFQNMISDCYAHDIDVVVTKSISRFARNTVDLLETLKTLKRLGVDVIFQQENLQSSEADDDLLISLLGAIAQAEIESIGESIRWGLQHGFASGKSKLYSRKCYGYKHDQNGKLVIVAGQAEVVRHIFDMYLNGHSIIQIIRELISQNIKSPQGKDTWSKRAIQTLLCNEKYTGRVVVGKTYSARFPQYKQTVNRGEQRQYIKEDTHEPIIGLDIFERVQAEIARRSNIEMVAGTKRRKNTHYSSKRKQTNTTTKHRGEMDV